MSMQVIEHIEADTGSVASIEFTSIPQTYTDLLVVYSLRNTANSVDANFTVNSSTTNRSSRRIYGSGSAVASNTTSTLNYFIVPSSATANTFGNGQIYIPNYTGSNAKSMSVDSVTEFNFTAAYQHLGASLWNDTAAITSIQILGTGSDLAQYSSATLYGITAGSDGTTTVS